MYSCARFLRPGSYVDMCWNRDFASSLGFYECLTAFSHPPQGSEATCARLVTRLQRQLCRAKTNLFAVSKPIAHRRGRLREWRAGKNLRPIREMRRRDCPSIDDENREKSEIFPL